MGSGAYSFSLPFTAASAVIGYMGAARLLSADTWHGQTTLASGASVFNCTFAASATNARAANMSGIVPAALAAGNTLRASLTYQSAT